MQSYLYKHKILNKMKTEEIEILQKNKIAIETKKELTSSCCGSTPIINEEANCQLDEVKKAIDQVGCGCIASALTVKSNCC